MIVLLIHSGAVFLAEEPNVADWIAAIGQAAGAIFTAGAVAVAVWLGWRDRKWRREDEAASRAERADRDAAQARLVTVEPDYGYNDWDLNAFDVKVHNGSSDPIFDVKISQLVAEGQATHPWDFFWGPLDPGPEHLRVLLGGKGFTWMVAYVDGRNRTVVLQGTDHITIDYVDAVGLRWQRTDHQPPRRVLEPTGDPTLPSLGPAGDATGPKVVPNDREEDSTDDRH